jgi:hypothetical protein
MPDPFSLPLQTWTPATQALHQAVAADDARAARAAIAEGADVQAEADVGPFQEPMTVLSRVLIGTRQDPQWVGLRQINLSLLSLVLKAAPSHWVEGPDAQMAMQSMTGHGVTNRVEAWDLLMAQGLRPTAAHLLDAVFPVSGAFPDSPKVVRALHRRLCPVALWDHLWPHLSVDEQRKAIQQDPFTFLFRGTVEAAEMAQAKWWLNQGANLGAQPERLVDLAPALAQRPAHQEALHALQRHEASLVDQRLSQLISGFRHASLLHEQGIGLNETQQATLSTTLHQLTHGWSTYAPDVQDRLRAAAPLQWFTNRELDATEQAWAHWLIDHGASVFTAYLHPVDEEWTHPLVEMHDGQACLDLARHEAELGVDPTPDPSPEWLKTTPALKATVQRLMQAQELPSPPRRRRSP